MGFMDKVKGLLKGHQQQVKGGIDTVSNKVEAKVGPKYADKVDDASRKAKEAVDKLAGSNEPTATPDPEVAAPVVATPDPPVAPPVATTPDPPASPPPAT
jgi:MT0933-like antitoxin protein